MCKTSSILSIWFWKVDATAIRKGIFVELEENLDSVCDQL